MAKRLGSKIYFGEFADGSLLSVEPKKDNHVYILAWSSQKEAVAYLAFAKIPEDVMVISMDIMSLPFFVKSWPEKTLLMLDRDNSGNAGVLAIELIKIGKFNVKEYHGEPPQVFDRGTTLTVIDGGLL